MGTGAVAFDPAADLVFHRRERLPFHSNGMRYSAYTTGPVIISGFGRWHPAFEARVKQVAGEHAPTATVKIDWTFPDEE